MSTSKYGQDAGSERDIVITSGESHVHFTVEPVMTKKEQKRERLRLAFGMARERASAAKFWEDSDETSLDDQLADVLVAMLVSAETLYRNGLARNREWIIERKAAAETELRKWQEEVERQARELQQKLARERITHLLAQAKALKRANQIRAYVESALLGVAETSIARADFDQWAVWARQEADRTDPVKNGMIAEAIRQHVQRTGYVKS
jgi:leucyl aminopeptidase (aminopeptidase T)